MKHCMRWAAGVCLLSAPALADDFQSQKLHNWHQWRGPEATGVAALGDPPTTWDENTNIKWKVEVPGAGSSTPIVWGNKLFITTAIETDREQAPDSASEPVGGNPFQIKPPTKFHKFVVICIDPQTGKTIWEHTATEQVPHEGAHRDHGYASPSATTDGENLYVSFGSRGLYAYGLDGQPQWDLDLGDMTIYRWFGEATSPVWHKDTLIINWDHEGESFLIALDAKTGETKWRVDRAEHTSWATPLIVERDGQTQIVVNGGVKARGYDFETGNVLWECGGQTNAIIPSPVATTELVFCMSGYPGSALYAIPLGSQGDITDTESVAWKLGKDTPYCPSPLLYGNRLWFNKTNMSVLTCLNATTGEHIIKEQRIPGLLSIYASPVGAADRVYFTARDGKTVVLKNSDQFEVLATNVLEDDVDASPAIVGKALFLRGKKNLYCISNE